MKVNLKSLKTQILDKITTTLDSTSISELNAQIEDVKSRSKELEIQRAMLDVEVRLLRRRLAELEGPK